MHATTPSDGPTAKRTAHQSVYEDLRAQILFGELAPGQAVTIQGLTQHSGAGITPVREAIRRLISDGALNMLGNRRVIVPHMTLDDLEQLDFMRKSIEPELARRVVRHLNDELISQLADTDQALNKAISQGDIRNYLIQNYTFHKILYSAARAPILLATVDRMWLRFGPSLRVVCGRHGTLNLPDKHADLLEALRARDAEAAAQAMYEDVEQGTEQIRNALQTA